MWETVQVEVRGLASWLDNFLAVPMVGFQIRPNFRILFNYQNILAPLLEEIYSTYDSVTFETQGTSAFTVKSKSGFYYELSPDNIVIKFTYLVPEERRVGQIPTLKEVHPQAYSQLLINLALEVKKVLMFFVENEILVRRVGVVAELSMSRDSIPPGITNLIEYLSKPWGSSLIKCNAALTPNLQKTDLVVHFSKG
ncbi:hypothetical protein K9N68_32625 [Kovacikia minuta CCNUW1]|uniref:hypothetical protein n=1 Tax=Kovacikia minuta TaxID=2931930 RepID=UPI001CCD5822|nr:hypothetical protein [Kovacikia minuta]UBF26204.1 hypothetical protein K9N68_32625 [Kovacikia minuta CCNUW1]